MDDSNSKLTIGSMAVLASAAATLLHEGVGHGLTAWLLGDIPTELTSNHLSSLRPDAWVDAAGTVVNLLAGGIALLISEKTARDANWRYFFWILAALNLLPGVGYFLFSGIFAVGDWYQIIRGSPHVIALRVIMAIFGAALYVVCVRLLAVAVKPFCPAEHFYNAIGRLPYFVACVFSCMAGALDPLGLQLFFVSTVPAAFGGSSGLLWADQLLPRKPLRHALTVRAQPAWWWTAAAIGICYIVIIGRGIHFPGPH